MEEAERLGFEPLRNLGSVCAVPLILYDRAVGVMAVHSPKERRVRRGPCGTAARAGERSWHRHRKRAALRGRAEKIAPTHADQQCFEPRHHDARSRRDAREDRRRNGKASRLRSYRHRHSRLLREGTGRPGRSRRAPRSRGPPHRAGRRTGRAGGAQRPDGHRPRGQHFLAARWFCPARSPAVALPVTYGEQLLGVLYVESSEPLRFPRAGHPAAAHARRSFCRRAAQCAHVPESPGAGHHRRPHRREDASLPDGSALGGMEAVHARQSAVCAGADGPRPLQVRQRFLRPPRRRRRPPARRPHPRAELPALRRGGALWRRRIRRSSCRKRRSSRPASSPASCAAGSPPIRCCATRTSPPASASPRSRCTAPRRRN